ncbi:endonuclease domain-containing protein [Amycolatopsis sp. WAC 04182]|uniref:endonuclease domain-containing protein n=1 Tax=Amycolatopsis sp. WAC 04182 TaxID=2203198 RepID=UPI0013153C4D|nr:endonuclease domain-containing protein [Amycolatopsis sp. WAC 04182]
MAAYCSDDRLSWIRRRLIDRGGPLCHACQRTIGVVADHDHFTGLCRGLLCWSCNLEIDVCPHLDGCPRAVYLNNPPALELRLRHPNAAKDRQHDHARIEYLGIDPVTPVRAWVRKI